MYTFNRKCERTARHWLKWKHRCHKQGLWLDRTKITVWRKHTMSPSIDAILSIHAKALHKISLTRSARFKYWSLWVTKITVFWFWRSHFIIPFSNKWRPTWTSNADNGSSYERQQFTEALFKRAGDLYLTKTQKKQHSYFITQCLKPLSFKATMF